ncbi:MAG: DUF4261 domain-containing protein [Lachnospiraceae bacterium]|nr:DUF4261 domain-containing protein [Lachnospiraceae bacterium]
MDEQRIQDAKDQLAEWRSDPRELGEKPAKLEYVKTFTDEEDFECMIFKFKKTPFSKWMLGIVSDAGVFSEMQEYNDATAEKDASECMEWLKKYWKDLAARQAGENEDDENRIKGFLGFILLSDKTWDKERFMQDLKNDWGIEPDEEEQGENEEQEDEEEQGDDNLDIDTAIFDVGSARVVLGYVDRPIPDGEAEQNAAMNYTWKEAVEVTRTHQANVLVSILGEHENPMEDGELFVKVVASLCRQENVIGVYANGVVYQPAFYFAMKEMIDEGMFPLMGLVWFGIIRTEKGFNVYTIGMNSFGKDDMEILDCDEDPNELRDFLMSMAAYCIEEDVVLRDGESIGVSAEHRCQISRSEGVCIDGMTLKIAYHKE